MSESPEWEPYSRKTWRIAFTLDVYGDTDKEAFGNVNRIVVALGERDEEKNLAQIGYACREAFRNIAGMVVYADQLREVVGPAAVAPLPSFAELLQRQTHPDYRSPIPGQTQLPDTGSDATELAPGRRTSAE